MPKEKETQEASGSLENFSFDDDNQFFGVKATTTNDDTTTVIKEVKKSGNTLEDEEIETTPKKTGKVKGTTVDEDDEDLEEEEVTFFEDEADKKKREAAEKKKAKEESVDDDEEEPKTKTKKKEKKDEEIEEEETQDEEEDKPKKTPKKKNEDVEGDDTEEEEDEEETKEKDDEFFTTLAEELKEKGIFQNIELEKGKKLTEEEFFELQDKEIEARVDETFQAFFEELPDDGKEFLRFIRAGGKPVDFLATYSTGIDLEKVDVDDEAQRTSILTHYLINYEKLDADELKDRLAYLKDHGTEKKYAEKWFNTMKEDEKTERDALIKAQEAVNKKRELQAKAFSESIEKLAVKTESVGVFPLTKADQKELPAYINKPLVKIGKNRYIPQLQADLSKILKAEDEESKKQLLILSKLIKNNFDVTDLVEKTRTKVVKSSKSKLQEAKKGVKAHSSGSNGTKGLADYFS